jgi:uncharacterized protein involved in outer membrane biogenesis
MLRKIITILLAVILVISLFTAAGLYYVMKDLAYYAAGALQPLEDKTGFRILFDDIAWRFSFGINVTFKNLKIVHIATGTTVLASERNYILLRLFPLLRRQFIVSKIIIDNPHLEISRNQDGTWPFYFHLPENIFEQTGDGPRWFPFSITLRRLLINNGDMIFHDFQRDTFVHLQKLNFDISRPFLFDPYRISCSSELVNKNETGNITLTGTINPASFSPRAPGFHAQGVIDVQRADLTWLFAYAAPGQQDICPQGFADIHFEYGVSSGLAINVSGLIKSEELTLPITSESPVRIKNVLARFDASGSRDAFDFKNCELTAPGIAVRGSASVTGLSQNPSYDAHLSTGMLTWKALRSLIPEGMLKSHAADYCNYLKDATIGIHALHVKGCISDAGSAILEQFNGNGELSNVTVALKNTLPPLHVTSGLFSFSREKLVFSELKTQWFGADSHAINGTIMQPFTRPLLDFSVITTAAADDLMAVISALAPGSQEKIITPHSGTINASTSIHYPASAAPQAEISAEIDLTRLNYSLGNFLKKPAGLENRAMLKTTFSFGTLPDAVQMSCSLNSNCLLLTGTLTDWNAPLLTGEYQLQNMDITSLGLLFMPSDMNLQGILNGKGAFTVLLQKSAVPAIQGTIDARSLALLKSGEPLPLLLLQARGFFKNDTLHVTQAAGSFGLTTASCSGDFNYGVNPLGRFNADVSYLELDDFIETVLKIKNSFAGHENSSAGPAVSERKNKSFFRRFVLDAPTTVQQGKYLSWNFSDGTTRVSIKDGVMTYGNIKLHAYQGIVNGTVIHDFSQPGVYRLTFLTSGKGIQFEEFLPDLQKKNIIAGKIKLHGMFTSLYKKGYEVVPNMEGNFSISMGDAKLGKFTVVSKIFSLLNFAEIVKLRIPDLLSRGMPLEAVDGTFVMNKGTAHTEDLFMKSPAMNLSAVGDLNFARKEINLIVGVQPLETVGKLLGSIPIAGKILTGENKSITVSYFKVSGPYADAAVTPIPGESLNQGVKALFKRFYKLPREILNPGKKSEKGS